MSTHQPEDPAPRPNIDDPRQIWGSGYRQQTVEILRPTTWRAVLKPLLIGVALVAIFNAVLLVALARTDERPLTTTKWDMLLALNAPVDWLILGDSTAATSLRPDVIHEISGVEAINLGTVGNWAMLDNVWMLEQYVARFGAPQGVIIVHALDTYQRSYPNEAVIVQAQRPPSFYDDYSVPLEASVTDEIEYYLLSYTPLFSRPDSAKDFIEELALGDEESAPISGDGFLSLEPDPANVVQDVTLFLSFIENEEDGTFTPSDVNQQAIDALIALAERYQFRIYLLHGPVFEGLLTEPAFQDYAQQVQAWLTRQADRSGQLSYLPTMIPFSREEMQNTDHLSPDAAADFTRTIIPTIIPTGQALHLAPTPEATPAPHTNS